MQELRNEMVSHCINYTTLTIHPFFRLGFFPIDTNKSQDTRGRGMPALKAESLLLHIASDHTRTGSTSH